MRCGPFDGEKRLTTRCSVLSVITGMMALYNRDELHVKLVESQGELKFECYKRDSIITWSFITKFHSS